MIKQISVFVENKKGRLYSLTKALAEHGVDLKALSIADTAKFGILRMIVSEPDKVLKIVHEANFTASETEVLGIEVEDRAGGLAEVLEVLTDNDIAVEYLYSFVRSQHDNAMIIFKVDDAAKASKLLCNTGLKLLTQEMV